MSNFEWNKTEIMAKTVVVDALLLRPMLKMVALHSVASLAVDVPRMRAFFALVSNLQSPLKYSVN